MANPIPSKPIRDENDHQPGTPKRRLWFWFVAGFLLVAIGMSLTVTWHTLDLSGQAVIECKLWWYYIFEIRRAVNSSGHLGPTTGSSSAALTTAFQHLLFSTGGGAVALAIGWLVRQYKGR